MASFGVEEGRSANTNWRDATSVNKKVAAFARRNRFSEHGAGRHAGTLGTLSDSAETKSLCDLGTGAGLGVGY